jgi:RNA polymerase sigma factor (sigma-70 family)
MTENLESELVQALAHDVASTFPRLMEIYQSQLYNFAVSQTHCEQTANDIVQECWIDIYQALHRYSAERIQTLKLRSWLFTIVHHRLCTYHNEKKKLPNILSIDDLAFRLEESGEPQAEDILDSKLNIEEVQVAIEQLPTACRTILTLLSQGFSYQEIAERQGQPVGTIRTAASRGKKLLRERLAANM